MNTKRIKEINGQVQIISYELNEVMHHGISLNGNNPEEIDFYGLKSLDKAIDLSNRINNQLNKTNANNLVYSIGSNVNSVSYDVSINKWVIKYKNNIDDDIVESNILMDFLINR